MTDQEREAELRLQLKGLEDWFNIAATPIKRELEEIETRKWSLYSPPKLSQSLLDSLNNMQQLMLETVSMNPTLLFKIPRPTASDLAKESYQSLRDALHDSDPTYSFTKFVMTDDGDIQNIVIEPTQTEGESIDPPQEKS